MGVVLGIALDGVFVKRSIDSLDRPQDVLGIRDCCWPIETLSKGIVDQGLGRRVVPAGINVNIVEQFLPSVSSDASLENLIGASGLRLYNCPSTTMKDFTQRAKH